MNNTKSIYPITTIILAIAVGVFIGLGFKDKTVYQVKNPEKWDGGNYQGWTMPCNYTHGSNADWDKEKREYGDQRYLDCANGLVYEKIGISPSTTYFNPNDDKLNAKYCKKGEVATFQYDDPFTKSGEGTFDDCINW